MLDQGSSTGKHCKYILRHVHAINGVSEFVLYFKFVLGVGTLSERDQIQNNKKQRKTLKQILKLDLIVETFCKAVTKLFTLEKDRLYLILLPICEYRLCYSVYNGNY